MNPSLQETSKTAAVLSFGVNLAGYVESEKGVGEAMRAGFRSIRAAGIPHVVNNVVDIGSLNWESGLAVSESNPFSTNLVYVSPDQVPDFFAERRGYFSHRFNIGCWSWELSSFPEEWHKSFQCFDEIWVPSSFVFEALSKVSPVPVITIPHSIEPPEKAAGKWNRKRFGLPPDKFVFFFMFDFHSTLERKNALGLIEAFRRAFGRRGDVLLLIKSVHSASAPAEFSHLQEASKAANVKLLDAVLSGEAVRGLTAVCDCYASLHRSEGFGLTLAEAMALGKPVIATGYSGNLDFMNERNSLLVRYRLTDIEQDFGPYKKGGCWAEPDLDHAAELFRYVVDKRDAAAAVAKQGREDILRRLHPAAVGNLMRERLLAATQEELVRRSQTLGRVQVRLDRESQELAEVQVQLGLRSQELEATRRDLGLKSQELGEVREQLGQRARELEAARKDRERRLQSMRAEAQHQTEQLHIAQQKLGQLQGELEGLAARLRDEQALRQSLQLQFQHLRYRIADRVNFLAKKSPALHRLAKSFFSRSLGWWEGLRRSRLLAGLASPPAIPQAGAEPEVGAGIEPVEPPRAQTPVPRFPRGPVPAVPCQTAELAGCTIVANNYLSQARVLAKSFRLHNPGCPFFVLIMGKVDGYFDPNGEPFLVVETDRLEIPQREAFFFKYNVLEASTAVKPYFLEHLLRHHNLEKLVYLDPDILVTGSFTALSSLLDQNSLVLTPHLTAPIEDGFHPGEFNILQAGAYNLGFVGLRKSDVTERMLHWWQDKVYRHCLLAPERGMHVDQRWVDLVPGLFGDVFVLREPGYNVAYWNLHERRVKVGDREIQVNGQPCYFFHFSGFEPDNPAIVSKHQNRFRLGDLGETAALFEQYRDRVLAEGWEETRHWPYSYDYFENGARIPALARLLYWAMGDAAQRFDDPFRVKPGSVFHWLNESVDGEREASRMVTRLWYEIYQQRGDLRSSFPDVLGVHRQEFLAWIRETGWRECGVDRSFLPSASLRTAEAGPPPSKDSRKQTAAPWGVNVVGYVASEKGMGEAVRSDIRSLQVARIPFVVNHFTDHFAANIETVSLPFSEDNPYSVNLFHVNADEVPVLIREKGEQFVGRYNIGYWTWELSAFPMEWRSHFACFDEIWVPSAFVREAVSAASPIPVVRVPHSINPEPRVGSDWTRARFGLDPEGFVFLFFFDFYSVMERKNPVGLVRAFRQAFGDRPDVTLFIKCSHSEWAAGEMARLQKVCQGARIVLQDAILPREAVNALLANCDAYVSLHRSEGFALTLAEAMTLGKPVIATAYSGNMDFMREDNSFLVRHKLVELEKDYGPYRKGCVWAEPDIDHAAEMMRRVVEDRAAAAAVARKGREDVLRQLHPDAVSGIMRERLLPLRNLGSLKAVG